MLPCRPSDLVGRFTLFVSWTWRCGSSAALHSGAAAASSEHGETRAAGSVHPPTDAAALAMLAMLAMLADHALARQPA